MFVDKEVQRYFKVKKFLSSQTILKETNDGLIIRYYITGENEILFLAKEWLPHMKILSPTSLQNKLQSLINEFLKDKKVGVKKFKDYDIYFERISIDKFLKSIGGEFVKNTITVNELLELIKKEDVIIVDTRSPREFKEETIPGAINIPLFLEVISSRSL